MEYKRIEIYVWRTCNQKCTYCMEFPNMERLWKTKVTEKDILKYLLKYKQKWYNHVTFLWWEPFIQPVFGFALKIWKKLWYTILVTTNATTLNIKKEAQKYLPYIDELILSVQWINKNKQQKTSRTKNFVVWEDVFKNIWKYWSGTYFKANIVLTKNILLDLSDICRYIISKNIKNISITYPDIDYWYYWRDHLLKYVVPTYEESIIEVIKINNTYNNINLKIVDFPFCVFPEKYRNLFIEKTDDIDYDNRLKAWIDLVDYWWKSINEMDRREYSPRQRKHFIKCEWCKYIDKCWGASRYYNLLYSLDEINPIKNIYN